jgi:uncharacterized OB-fold protein
LAAYTKPLPIPDAETQPFWDACAAHELRAQRCTSCSKFRWPPAPLCPHCRSWDFEWARLDGTGEVYSYVIVHHSVVPAFAAEMPYVVAQVALDGAGGAVRMTTNIVDCPPEKVMVGMRVAVAFEDATQEISLPKFRPAG